jgi:hypothetical protein
VWARQERQEQQDQVEPNPRLKTVRPTQHRLLEILRGQCEGSMEYGIEFVE